MKRRFLGRKPLKKGGKCEKCNISIIFLVKKCHEMKKNHYLCARIVIMLFGTTMPWSFKTENHF